MKDITEIVYSTSTGIETFLVLVTGTYKEFEGTIIEGYFLDSSSELRDYMREICFEFREEAILEMRTIDTY